MVMASNLLIEHFQSEREDLIYAGDRAKKFMTGLFSGNIKVACKCGEKIKYKNSILRCQNCGEVHNRVEYIDDYGDRDIRTVIDVDNHKFELSIKE